VSKIIVDVAMTVFLVLSFIRWEGDPAFHYIVGIGCTVFFILHVIIHSKWLKAATKACFRRKLKKKAVFQYVVNMLLIIVWSLSLITGFLSIGYFSGGVLWMSGFGRFHGITARIGLGLIVVHFLQHWRTILSYIGIKIKKRQIKKQQQHIM